MDRLYNPLDTRNIGVSIIHALLGQPVFLCSELDPFYGPGIYAIYYTGDFALYQTIAAQNPAYFQPIYVGKAVSKGGRKGGYTTDMQANPLFNRLKDHSRSIDAAINLELNDFSYRYLVLEDIWIGLGESLLIEQTRPLWNLVIEGFGNHDPGRSRYNGQKPQWDVLHPGREWAERLQPNKKSLATITSRVQSFLAGDASVELPAQAQSAEAESDQA